MSCFSVSLICDICLKMLVHLEMTVKTFLKCWFETFICNISQASRNINCQCFSPVIWLDVPCVWGESNHRMTSTGWWVLCKVRPNGTVTRPKCGFLCEMPNHLTPQRVSSFGRGVTSKRQNQRLCCIRFWCRMLTNRDYLMTHLRRHIYLLSSSLTEANTAGFICSHTAWNTLPHGWPHPVIWFNEQSGVTNHSVRGMTGEVYTIH